MVPLGAALGTQYTSRSPLAEGLVSAMGCLSRGMVVILPGSFATAALDDLPYRGRDPAATSVFGFIGFHIEGAVPKSRECSRPSCPSAFRWPRSYRERFAEHGAGRSKPGGGGGGLGLALSMRSLHNDLNCYGRGGCETRAMFAYRRNWAQGFAPIL